jgi:hypothetical protein
MLSYKFSTSLAPKFLHRFHTYSSTDIFLSKAGNFSDAHTAVTHLLQKLTDGLTTKTLFAILDSTYPEKHQMKVELCFIVLIFILFLSDWL